MSYQKQHQALKLATLFVITACYVVVVGSLVFGNNFKRVIAMWGEDVQMTVYLSPEVSDEQKLAIEQKIQSDTAVERVEFISQAQALGDFKEQLASYAPEVTKDEDLLTLIPASFYVVLKNDVPLTQQSLVLASLEQSLKGLAGVDEISYGQDWVEKYSSFVKVVDWAFAVLIVIILLAAILVVSNSLRASISNRREEIVVLEMIGATYSSIRKPFLIEGAILGGVATSLSLGISYILLVFFKGKMAGALSFLKVSENMQFLSFPAVLIVLIAGTGIGVAASFLSVRSINDGYAGSQR